MSPRKASPRRDGWVNIMTGLGTSRDKRLYAQWCTAAQKHMLLWEDLYRGNDLAARIADTKPQEAFREGLELHVPDSKEMGEAMLAAAEDLEFLSDAEEASSWSRAYGGGALVMGINEGRKADLSKPVNEAGVKSIDWLRVLTPMECQVYAWGENGKPVAYQLNPLTPGALPQSYRTIVHASRVLAFQGIKVSNRQALEHFNYGWADSVFVRIEPVLKTFELNWETASALIADFAQAVWKIKGLNQLIAANEDQVIQNRIRAGELSRSAVRALIIDAEDSHERQTTPMGGLPDLMEKFSLRMAAAADMPVSLLMGQSPAGLNATGDSDIRFWYQKIGAFQRKKLRPLLNRFLHLLFLAKQGPTGGVEPDNWTVKFPSLWQQTELEKSQTRWNTAQSDNVYLTQGVVSPLDVARSRFGGDEYSQDTIVDMDELDKREQAKQQARQQLAANPPPALPPGQKPPPPIDPKPS